MYEHGSGSRQIQKQIQLLKTRRELHRDARASRGRERGEEKERRRKEREREWRAGEKTTLSLRSAASCGEAERSEARRSEAEPRKGENGEQLGDAEIGCLRGSLSCAREWAREEE